VANPLLYNAIDQYLYIDTQLDARTAQAAREECRRTQKATTVGCCLCCLCCRNEAVAIAKQPKAADLQNKINSNPFCLKHWEEIPNMNGTEIHCNGGVMANIPASTVKTIWVCDFTGPQSRSQPSGCGSSCSDRSGYVGCYYRCGSCCQFTVPSGVTKVQFDAWGPGAFTPGSTCCGGSPHGSTGAFLSMQLEVTPGDAYCICAGCSMCCSAQAYPNYSCQNHEWSYPTCIEGPGLCNVRVEAGNMKAVAQIWLRGTVPGSMLVNQCYGNLAGGSGQCWCNHGYHCFDNSCSTCGVMGGVASLSQAFGCTCKGFMYKIPGLWGPYCLDTNNYGFYQAAPVPFFAECSQHCFSFSSNSCGGCNCSSTETPYMKMPGAGGSAVHVMGGCCICGARGNMGAVRITYDTA